MKLQGFTNGETETKPTSVAPRAKSIPNDKQLEIWRIEFEKCKTSDMYRDYIRKYNSDNTNPYLSRAKIMVNKSPSFKIKEIILITFITLVIGGLFFAFVVFMHNL
jgi:hypothetical protein